MAGGLAGLGLALAAAAPFSGVPPQGTSGGLAPAQIEVKALASNEFTLDPLGTVLKAAPFPATGERGGPGLQIGVRSISGVPLRVSVRLVGIAPSLSDAVLVRASVGGAVVLDGPLREAQEWSVPKGRIRPGESSTLRIRFRLRPGLRADEFAGRLDIRQLEVRGVRPGQVVEEPTGAQQQVDGPTSPTTPIATTPPPSTPPVVSPTTPAPRPSGDPPRRFAPDAGGE